MMRALMWKELREQLERWLPATLLLAGVELLLIRARLASIRETTVMVMIFGGILLSIVLVIAPVPSERTRGTLEFLRALPVDGRRVLLAKWLVGELSIAGMFAVCVLAGVLTAGWVGADASWMVLAALCVSVSMMAFHTLLLILLRRARNELDAALYAFFLGVIVGVWSSYAATAKWLALCVVGYVGPAAPVFALLREGLDLLLVSAFATALIWIVAPGVWLWRSGQGRMRA
jgi:hypothetical protein